MTFAEVSDIAQRLGRPASSPTESSQWEAWLSDVESIILGRIPDLASRISDGRPTLATVVMVEANAVIRKILNPEGKRSERIDDYSYDRGELLGNGSIFLTDEEWALLIGSPDGAFTIRPAGDPRRRGQWIHPDVWVPLP